ncbi:MAG TPA: methyltransferase domain-containing protein [Rubrobacteraceae bacterium]|nr:methyltransferase domain-containing protein [Rubrobacteraceae bacterium]
MFRKDLLPIIRVGPSREDRLTLVEGTEEDGWILHGTLRSQQTGETFTVRGGYLDLLKRTSGAYNIANLTNFLPGAGRGYEPLWRTRSLTLLTGEPFPNERELEIISGLVNLERGGRYLDLGCSAGLYTRSLARELDGNGDVVGVDISPSMLREAARRIRAAGAARASLARADAENLPFADGSFAGAVCGGSLNEFGDPARALRETRRVLEPGGRIAIMGILRARTSRGRRLQRFLSTSGIKFFVPDEIWSMLAHAGFDPDPLEVHGSVFFAGANRR